MYSPYTVQGSHNEIVTSIKFRIRKRMVCFGLRNGNEKIRHKTLSHLVNLLNLSLKKLDTHEIRKRNLLLTQLSEVEKMDLL